MKMSIEEYVTKYLSLVSSITFSYYKELRIFNISRDDLYQVGCLGLVESYYTYNEEKACTSTHAYNCIRYSILKYINANNSIIKLPNDISMAARIVANTKKDYFSKYNKEITLEELIVILGGKNLGRKVTKKFIKYLERLNNYYFNHHVLSLEQPIIDKNIEEDESLETIKDTLISPVNIEEEVIGHTTAQERLNNSCLTLIEKQIFEKNIGLVNNQPKSKYELGQEFGMSYQGIDYHYKKAKRKIKEKWDVYS